MLRALIFCLLASGAVAETPHDIAEAAAERLRLAEAGLRRAEGARDRVGALTETIRAYEEGLAALRAGLRGIVLRETEIQASFQAESAELARLLAVLQTIEAAPAPLLLFSPSGPVGTVRSGMLLSDVTPALDREVRALSARLEEVAALREIQEVALAELEDGLAGVQSARLALNTALAERGDLPLRFSADRAALQRLLDSAETLTEFARGLPTVAGGEALAALPSFDQAKARLDYPVAGRQIRQFGEADAAGIRRPGLILATRPQALVTAPWPSTLRYRGPLLDYGNVVILETGADHLMVLAGMGTLYGEIGEILPAGAPLGLMTGQEDDGGSNLAEAEEGGGIRLTETLYIEIRERGEPVDPAAWFAKNKD